MSSVGKWLHGPNLACRLWVPYACFKASEKVQGQKWASGPADKEPIKTLTSLTKLSGRQRHSIHNLLLNRESSPHDYLFLLWILEKSCNWLTHLFIFQGLDYERNKERKLEIVVNNEAPYFLPPNSRAVSTSTCVVVVKVRDMDEGPVFDPCVFFLNIKECLPAETMVGQYTARDPETGNSEGIMYSILLPNSCYTASVNTTVWFTGVAAGRTGWEQAVHCFPRESLPLITRGEGWCGNEVSGCKLNGSTIGLALPLYLHCSNFPATSPSPLC